MSPIVLAIADGTAFFIGLVMVLAAGMLLRRAKAGLVRSPLNVFMVTGVIMVVISSTPLPLWAYGVWGVAATAALVLGQPRWTATRLSAVALALLLVVTAILAAVEFPHRLKPHLPVANGTVVYVLGDSVSAGMGTADRCWPEGLGKRRADLRIVNLAQPGATVESAFAQAAGMGEANALVIIEIGGNDLLSGTPAPEFRERLDRLVSGIRAAGHPVLLLELPLFPFQNAYGEAQREIAAARGAALLPKRYFTRVLGLENATLDGLHLSQAGHDALADIVSGVLVAEKAPAGG